MEVAEYTTTNATTSTPTTTVRTFVHTDHLGSTNIITDDAGSVVESLDYYPYGESRVDQKVGDTNDKRKYIGQFYDDTTGLTYLNARYYDAKRGQFLSQDPAVRSVDMSFLFDPQQMNFYSYGRNNPIRFTDADGKKVWDFQPYLPSGKNYSTGDLLGRYKGTEVYSPGVAGGFNHPYQCVTFAKDFARNQFGVNLQGTGNGSSYGSQSNIDFAYKANNPDNPGVFSVYSNNSKVMPQEDDIISWSGNSVGHVGVIAEVTFDDKSGSGKVYTVEQNFKGDQALFSQSITKDKDGNYSIGDRGNYKVIGWTRFENQSKVSSPKNSTPYTPAVKQAKKSG
jgi:RHS repeat-associated protein